MLQNNTHSDILHQMEYLIFKIKVKILLDKHINLYCIFPMRYFKVKAKEKWRYQLSWGWIEQHLYGAPIPPPPICSPGRRFRRPLTLPLSPLPAVLLVLIRRVIYLVILIYCAIWVVLLIFLLLSLAAFWWN